MELRHYIPFQQAKRGRPPKTAQLAKGDDLKALSKAFKAVGLALGFAGGSTYVGNRTNFEPSPYDFDRIIAAIDTDSYMKQAFNKYKELIWKEGYEFVSENPDALDYLKQRVDFMELSMGQPFSTFLVELGDQLVKFSNAFVVKVRGNLAPHFPAKLKVVDGSFPVIGYQIIPAETMEILRDRNNKILAYRQNIYNLNCATGSLVTPFGTDQKQWPTWQPQEVIHFCTDRKPGRVFGTPFVVAVMDDLVGLRQIEEDIQNLIHRELFPLYKYKVGTDEDPAEPDEIDRAAAELANLRTEGGLVLPDRHDVEVIGADGSALQVDPYLQHFKERVCVGLGLAPHHLGMMMNGGNRSVTDRLDIALYDKIKTYQRYIAAVIRLKVFNELLLEGGFDPYEEPDAKGDSDRCIFKFNEIDVDSAVKRENHIIQKWTSDLMEIDEARIALSMSDKVDEKQLYSALSARMMPMPGKPIKPGASSTTSSTTGPSSGGANNQPTKPDAQTPSAGGKPNLPKGRTKAISQKSRPANQHGKALSPGIRHADDLDDILELIDEDEQE